MKYTLKWNKEFRCWYVFPFILYEDDWYSMFPTIEQALDVIYNRGVYMDKETKNALITFLCNYEFELERRGLKEWHDTYLKELLDNHVNRAK